MHVLSCWRNVSSDGEALIVRSMFWLQPRERRGRYIVTEAEMTMGQRVTGQVSQQI